MIQGSKSRRFKTGRRRAARREERTEVKMENGALREGIVYIIVGVMTTAIDYIVSNALYYLADMSSVPAQTISFIAAVLFAFVANKWWVFRSYTLAPKAVWKEFYSFVICRIATFLFSLAATFILVDLMGNEFFICKLLVSVVVMVLNYVFSKLLIFSHKKDGD